MPLADQFIHESQRERLDRRTNQNVCVNRVQRSLQEKSKGEQGLSPDAFQANPASSGRYDRIGQQQRSLCRQVADEKASVDVLPADNIEQPHRETGQAGIAVGH